MSIINTLNSDRFNIVFSNIPQPSTATEKLQMGIFNNYVKGITLPDYNLETLQSDFTKVRRLQPVSRVNTDLTQVTIDFFADEDLENYHSLYSWIQEIRAGRKTKDSTSLHTSTINEIKLLLKDNQVRERAVYTFKECFLTNISSLTLQFGSSQEVTFSCSFIYNDFVFTKSTNVITNN